MCCCVRYLLSISNLIAGLGNCLAHVCVAQPKWLSSLLFAHPTWTGGIFCTFRWVIVSILLTNTRVSCVGGNLCSTVAVGASSMCRYTVEKNFGGIPSVFSSVPVDEPIANSIGFRAATPPRGTAASSTIRILFYCSSTDEVISHPWSITYCRRSWCCLPSTAAPLQSRR